MKFKKVEIQAFRAYDKAEDSTFDFELSKDTNADFVSIYAPNGFGKTSFYDAVEYGVTKNINRFLQRQTENKDAAKTERAVSIKGKQFILRNKFSDDKLDCYIKLFTTNSPTPSITKIAKPARKGSVDYKFDRADTENIAFQSVILSQEWIDAFLKEDTSTDRFDKFVEHFGDKKMDQYYRKLTDLINFSQKKCAGLKKDLVKLKDQLVFDGDHKILQKVNEKIAQLKAEGERLSAITTSFSKADELKLVNSISARRSDLDFELKKSESGLAAINAVYSGSDEFISLDIYLAQKARFTELTKRMEECLALKKAFEIRKLVTGQLATIAATLKEFYEAQQSRTGIKIQFPEYNKIAADVTKGNQETKAARDKVGKLEKDISALRQSAAQSQIKVKNKNEQIAGLELTLQKLPQLLEQINKLNKDLAKAGEALGKLNDSISKSDAEGRELKKIRSALNGVVTEITKGIYSATLSVLVPASQPLTEILSDMWLQLKAANTRKRRIDKSFKEQESVQKDIDRFIALGAQIVQANRFSDCPLCSQHYDSFAELGARIAGNKLVSPLFSSLIQERRDNEEEIKRLNTVQLTTKKSLDNLVNKEISATEKKVTANQQASGKLKERQSKILTEIHTLTTKLLATKTESGDQASKAALERRLADHKKELPNLAAAAETLNGRVLKANMDLQVEKSRLTEILKHITALEKNSSYTAVTAYFKTAFPGKKPTLALLNDSLEQLNNEISDALREEKNKKAELERLNKSLAKIDEKLNASEIQDIEYLVATILQTNSRFETNCLQQFDIKPAELGQREFKQALEQKKKTIQKQTAVAELLIKEYTLLSELIKNVGPYLSYEQAKQTEAALNERIQFLTETVEVELTKERTKVSAHIDKQIDNFFYEELINDLYKRIDPHPDYKHIKFVTDFSDDKPKLNVCVYQNKQDELIIPNLYFSTAQLNILSLSIFLAKALNAKDENGVSLDCIFIDDPIQAMDSINILSTIDLLRSIVVNQKKQIILSTHDENFHSLLKKKMPPGLFKSKFMELETFGKVKDDKIE